MTSILSKFNEQFLNFLGELKDLFPEDPVLKNFYHTVEFVKKTNPREIMNQFKTYVYPYKDQILKREEVFFIQNSFSDDVVHSSSISEMLRIKSIWVSGKLTKEDKECIWNYFKVFIYLIEKEYPNKN